VLTQKNLSNSALWLLFAITVVPIGILAFYNHPSVDDDYCFAYMTRDHGFWKAQKFYYEGWSGRYISNMIFHATPLAFGVFWFVKVMPFLILGLLFHAIYTFIGEILKSSKANQLLLTATFLSIFIIFSSSVVDTFFWYSSVFIFPTSFSFFLYFIVVVLRFYQPQYQRIKYPIALLAATLIFFIVGSNEVMMLFIIGLCGAVWGYILLFHKRFEVLFFILMLVGLYFAYFWVVQAKGNQIRLVGGNVLGGAISLSLKNALKSTVFDGLKWSLVLSPFAYLYVNFLPDKKITETGRSFTGRIPVLHSIFKANIWMVILGLFIVLFMMFFVIHYGNDMGVPDRVKNVIFAVFLVGYFYIFTIIKHSYSINYKIKSHLVSYGIVTLIIGLSVIRYGQNLKTMYADIRLGIAKRYDQEMTQRYEQIRTSKSDTIYVAPLKNIPKSLCFDDIKTNEQHLWNKCYATYFDKKVIILKEK
jgi:hypothetical protein